MTDLHSLRNQQLDEKLAAKLAPFVAAYRWDECRIVFEKSYDRRVRLRQLIEEGVKPLPEDESFTDELQEVYFETHGFYPDEHPDLRGPE